MFKRKSNPAQLQEQLSKLKGGAGFSEQDKNEWKLKVDKDGNGSAVIRFLPGKGDDGLPFIKLVNHGFKKNGKWYIENCTSTHGDYDSCPVCTYIKDNDLYNKSQNDSQAKKLYDDIKRKTSFWANILVVRDPANPDNEGKVFKYRFGQKIMEKIQAMIEVDTSLGETPVDVTCAWEGANFLLKAKKNGNFLSYDDSKFQGVSAIDNIDDETRQQELFEAMIDLGAMVKPEQFKSFEKNKEAFDKIMGTASMKGSSSAASAAGSIESQLDNFDAAMDKFNEDQDDLDDLMSTPTPQASKKGSESVGEDIEDILNML